MVSKIDHIGIAVSNLEETVKLYTDFLGLKVEKTETHAEQKVNVAFLPIGDTEFELLEPNDPESAIAKFIKTRGEGIQHIALRVENIEEAIAEMRAKGMRFIDEKPRIGAGGTKIAFLHPKNTHGVLLELVQVK
jgi:methylmalonyl-CoA/ethylmalonyl-CoA epimerase